MRIDAYRSVRNRTKYLLVPAGTNIGTAFPSISQTHPDLQSISPFLMDEEFQTGDPRAGFNTGQILSHIAEDGFAIASTTLTILRSTIHRA
jgi:hypothetical protein